MSTYPRDRLTAAQVATLHERFLASGGFCDAWVDTITGAVALTRIGAETVAFVTRHSAAIAQGTLRLVQW